MTCTILYQWQISHLVWQSSSWNLNMLPVILAPLRRLKRLTCWTRQPPSPAQPSLISHNALFQCSNAESTESFHVATYWRKGQPFLSNLVCLRPNPPEEVHKHEESTGRFSYLPNLLSFPLPFSTGGWLIPRNVWLKGFVCVCCKNIIGLKLPVSLMHGNISLRMGILHNFTYNYTLKSTFTLIPLFNTLFFGFFIYFSIH